MPPSANTTAAAESAGAIELVVAALISFGLAAATLTRSRWGPLLEPFGPSSGSAAVVGEAAPVYAAISAGHAFVLWTLNRYLQRRFQYHAADRIFLMAVSALVIDLLANVYLIVSGAPGFQSYGTSLGFYQIILSYPQLAYFALAVILIALGYSLLRFPYNLYGLLRYYAQALIVTGAALAAPPFAMFWPFAAAVSHGLLGALLFRAFSQPNAALVPRARRVRPA